VTKIVICANSKINAHPVYSFIVWNIRLYIPLPVYL